MVERLDGAFAVLVEILDRHGGIVNKFLGDGFLALFGAPFETAGSANHAVEAAREMLAAMEQVNDSHSWPLRIGIGIHFGEVVAGNIGSPRRKEYTVIGDTVNFAARLEALNKEFNSQLLVSAAVATRWARTVATRCRSARSRSGDTTGRWRCGSWDRRHQMQRRYVTVDVFTDRAFGGNPLAVVLDAGGLSTAQMQAIAHGVQLFRDDLRAAAAGCGA